MKFKVKLNIIEIFVVIIVILGLLEVVLFGVLCNF